MKVVDNTECASEPSVPEILARQHWVIGRSQALDAGLSRRQIQWRLDSGQWRRVHDAVYRVTAVPVSYEQRLMAASLATSGVVSHRSAGELLGLDVRRPSRPEVTSVSHRTLAGAVVHQTRHLSLLEIEPCGPFLVTGPARTVVDVAAVLAPHDVEAALDSALRDGLTPDQLHECLDRNGRQGRKGTALLRELVDDRRRLGVSRSRRESALHRALVTAGLTPPLRNHVVRDPTGLPLAEVDLAWPAAKVAVEFDSYRYHHGRAAWRRDQVRRNRLTALGWLVIAATEQELGPRLPDLIRSIRLALGRSEGREQH